MTLLKSFSPLSCNLHGACGGKDAGCAGQHCADDVAICTERVEAKPKRISAWRRKSRLQSARSVWRQRHRRKARTRPVCVAICTERVEAKSAVHNFELHHVVAICTERVEAKACGSKNAAQTGKVAICTERVEAKPSVEKICPQTQVAICTERVEAKQI